MAHPIFSFLSTNMVENFFSIIRSKFRYPSLAMYATAYHAAYNYLVWRLSPDSGCPQFKAPIGQAYGNAEGIAFSFKTDVRHWSPSEKETAIKKTYVDNTTGISSKDEQDRLTQAALEIAARLRPTRKLLTIREATCKKRPGRCHLVLCEAKGCPRMFTYAGAYATHKTRCHPELSDGSAVTSEKEDGDAIAADEGDDDAGNPVTYDTVELDWVVVIIDVETTGRSKTARIVQLAARTANGSAFFNKLVKPPPGTIWEAGAVRVTGITASTVKHAEPFAVVITKFMSWLERLNCEHVLLVGHNAHLFDRHGFAYEFSLLPGDRSVPPSNWHWADSLALARARFPGEPASLEAVRGSAFFLSAANSLICSSASVSLL